MKIVEFPKSIGNDKAENHLSFCSYFVPIFGQNR